MLKSESSIQLPQKKADSIDSDSYEKQQQHHRRLTIGASVQSPYSQNSEATSSLQLIQQQSQPPSTLSEFQQLSKPNQLLLPLSQLRQMEVNQSATSSQSKSIEQKSKLPSTTTAKTQETDMQAQTPQLQTQYQQQQQQQSSQQIPMEKEQQSEQIPQRKQKQSIERIVNLSAGAIGFRPQNQRLPLKVDMLNLYRMHKPTMQHHNYNSCKHGSTKHSHQNSTGNSTNQHLSDSTKSVLVSSQQQVAQTMNTTSQLLLSDSPAGPILNYTSGTGLQRNNTSGFYASSPLNHYRIGANTSTPTMKSLNKQSQQQQQSQWSTFQKASEQRTDASNKSQLTNNFQSQSNLTSTIATTNCIDSNNVPLQLFQNKLIKEMITRSSESLQPKQEQLCRELSIEKPGFDSLQTLPLFQESSSRQHQQPFISQQNLSNQMPETYNLIDANKSNPNTITNSNSNIYMGQITSLTGSGLITNQNVSSSPLVLKYRIQQMKLPSANQFRRQQSTISTTTAATSMLSSNTSSAIEFSQVQQQSSKSPDEKKGSAKIIYSKAGRNMLTKVNSDSKSLLLTNPDNNSSFLSPTNIPPTESVPSSLTSSSTVAVSSSIMIERPSTSLLQKQAFSNQQQKSQQKQKNDYRSVLTEDSTTTAMSTSSTTVMTTSKPLSDNFISMKQLETNQQLNNNHPTFSICNSSRSIGRFNSSNKQENIRGRVSIDIQRLEKLSARQAMIVSQIEQTNRELQTHLQASNKSNPLVIYVSNGLRPKSVLKPAEKHSESIVSSMQKQFMQPKINSILGATLSATKLSPCPSLTTIHNQRTTPKRMSISDEQQVNLNGFTRTSSNQLIQGTPLNNPQSNITSTGVFSNSAAKSKDPSRNSTIMKKLFSNAYDTLPIQSPELPFSQRQQI